VPLRGMDMRAVRLLHPAPIEEKPLQSVAVPIPQPGPGQVLVRVRACGVCHTDLHTAEGDIVPPAYPVTLGHQVVGTVETIGPDQEAWGVGDRVGIPWLHWACGECGFCRRGDENLCSAARFTGLQAQGGYAEYLLAEARFALGLGWALSDEQAAPLLCAGIIGYRSLRKADLQPGERIGLFGFGASAHLAVQVALHWGCEVCVFTRGEGHRRLARKLGAAWVGGAEESPPGPLDRAVLFAPVGGLVPVILEKLRPGGTLAINAIHASPLPEMPYSLLYGERTLRSVANATRQDGVEFLKLAQTVPIRSATRSYPLEEANRALLDLKRGRIDGAGVLLP
jgi:propanol-preferring alcohol dehydrogenase